MSSSAEFARQEGLEGPALLEALLHEKDVQPIRSVNDLACKGIFDTDRLNAMAVLPGTPLVARKWGEISAFAVKRGPYSFAE